MRIATFNTENLFSRPKVMNLKKWSDGQEILDDVYNLNNLIAKTSYSDSDKENIKQILMKYEFNNRQKQDRPFSIIEVRKKLYKIKKEHSEIEIVADGADKWLGWVELTRENIGEEAINNTGRVISEVRADILCVVEVENRTVLSQFNKQILKSNFGLEYKYNMLIDGNDPRGIDVGVLSNNKIVSVRSHTEDGGDNPIFSRDCPEFEIQASEGSAIWLLGNHFKSKGYGNLQESDAKRKRQASEVAKIYIEARKRSDYVIVLGDLNDSPESEVLQPLLEKTDLRDVMFHPAYNDVPGTYGSCKSSKQKIDYLLLSPALWGRVKRVGIERRGIYAPQSGPMFDTVTGHTSAASDHAALWVDIE